jgi:hypothetical protein
LFANVVMRRYKRLDELLPRRRRSRARWRERRRDGAGARNTPMDAATPMYPNTPMTRPEGAHGATPLHRDGEEVCERASRRRPKCQRAAQKRQRVHATGQRAHALEPREVRVRGTAARTVVSRRRNRRRRRRRRAHVARVRSSDATDGRRNDQRRGRQLHAHVRRRTRRAAPFRTRCSGARTHVSSNRRSTTKRRRRRRVARAAGTCMCMWRRQRAVSVARARGALSALPRARALHRDSIARRLGSCANATTSTATTAMRVGICTASACGASAIARRDARAAASSPCAAWATVTGTRAGTDDAAVVGVAAVPVPVAQRCRRHHQRHAAVVSVPSASVAVRRVRCQRWR